jgi:hypothetical protein
VVYLYHKVTNHVVVIGDAIITDVHALILREVIGLHGVARFGDTSENFLWSKINEYILYTLNMLLGLGCFRQEGTAVDQMHRLPCPQIVP